MSNIVDDLHRSADLIKSIGDSLFLDGRSLSESLTIDGIPYWDVFAPELAMTYLPFALAESDYNEIYKIL